MKKSELDGESHGRLALMSQSEVVGADVKAALDYIGKLEIYIEVHDKFIQDLTSRLNMSGKEQRKKINKIKVGLDRYYEQASEFAHRAICGEFDDYPGYKEACDISGEK